MSLELIKSGGKEEETMKDMRRVKNYFKKTIYSELIGMIRRNIGKDVWNNSVARRRYGVAFDYDDDLVDIDVVTGMIVIEASRQGHFDEFDYETKTEIVEFIMDEFKELAYKTFHEICMEYRDVDVKCDIYEFMHKFVYLNEEYYSCMLKATRDKNSVTEEMRNELIRVTNLRFNQDLMMDCQRNETLEEYIEDVTVLMYPIKRKAA